MNKRKPRGKREAKWFWLTESNKRTIVDALLASLPPDGGLSIKDLIGIVNACAPRPVSKATVYRLLWEAGWEPDGRWSKFEDGRACTIRCDGIHSFVERTLGHSTSKATAYRYMKDDGWTRSLAWLPPKRGNRKNSRGIAPPQR